MKKMELTFTATGTVRGARRVSGERDENLVRSLSFYSASLLTSSWALVSAKWVSGCVEVM